MASSIDDWRLSYEISPIYLTNGIAGQMAGSTLPLISILGANDYLNITTGSNPDVTLDNVAAHFYPLPGASLLTYQLGEYPFANQSVAANAIITEPLILSMMMVMPWRQPGDAFAKVAIVAGLQATLSQHALSGGTYTIATPSFVYTDMILLNLVAVEGGETRQPQARYRWDFRMPLITQAAAAQAQNNLMSKVTNQTQTTPNADGVLPWSSPNNAVGDAPSGNAPATVPATQPSPTLGWSPNPLGPA